MIWGAISYDWKSLLIYLKGAGGGEVTENDCMETVMGPVEAPAFSGSLEYVENSDSLYV